eukprot:4950057-Heterocapsa_arctica.AAC.1
MGQGLEDERSALFWELPRIANVCADAFAGLPMIDFTENVASMSVANCLTMSEGLGRHPVFICPSGASTVARPRLFWPDFTLQPCAGVEVIEGEVCDFVFFTGRREPEALWVRPGGKWCGTPSTTLPTFTRSLPRREPPFKPAGFDRCDHETLQRWANADYKFP